MAAANIGMMDGAYFVGRNEILQWINTSLQLNLMKVEDVRSIKSQTYSQKKFIPFIPLLSNSYILHVYGHLNLHANLL
jgi:hypothetical protein